MLQGIEYQKYLGLFTLHPALCNYFI